MGKTPAQEKCARAKKGGLSHDAAKKAQAKDSHDVRELEVKNLECRPEEH